MDTCGKTEFLIKSMSNVLKKKPVKCLSLSSKGLLCLWRNIDQKKHPKKECFMYITGVKFTT